MGHSHHKHFGGQNPYNLDHKMNITIEEEEEEEEEILFGKKGFTI